MKVIGLIIKKKVRMEIYMKDGGLIVIKKVKELTLGMIANNTS